MAEKTVEKRSPSRNCERIKEIPFLSPEEFRTFFSGHHGGIATIDEDLTKYKNSPVTSVTY
jgi:hypothetical protein